MGNFLNPLQNQNFMTKIKVFSFPFQRRTSREGLLNEMEGAFGEGGASGSTDPLLQIPSQLSAVLTLKRGGGSSSSPSNAQSKKAKSGSTLICQSNDSNRTPLLKRKRESIV